VVVQLKVSVFIRLWCEVSCWQDKLDVEQFCGIEIAFPHSVPANQLSRVVGPEVIVLSKDVQSARLFIQICELPNVWLSDVIVCLCDSKPVVNGDFRYLPARRGLHLKLREPVEWAIVGNDALLVFKGKRVNLVNDY